MHWLQKRFDPGQYHCEQHQCRSTLEFLGLIFSLTLLSLLVQIWFSSEPSYNTSCYHNVRVVRNRALRTGYVFDSTNCSDSTLPATGIDRSNVPDLCEDVYWADNVIVDSCRQGFRVSGWGTSGAVVVGNRFEDVRTGVRFPDSS